MLKHILAMVVGVGLATVAPAAPTFRVDEDARNINVFGTVDGRMVLPAMNKLAAIKYGRVSFVIDSYGGSVAAGIALIQVMHQVQARGVEIDCLVTGNAMSMAFIILAECDNRYALSDSQLLWHPIRVGIGGTLTGNQARALARDLLDYERPFLQRLRTQVKMPATEFMYHWNNETVHIGSTLAQTTGFVEIVQSVTGAPVSELFQFTTKTRSPFDKIEQTSEGGGVDYQWVAPTNARVR
jgi:ATP-dependent protease ClpP protease subunit